MFVGVAVADVVLGIQVVINYRPNESVTMVTHGECGLPRLPIAFSPVVYTPKFSVC